jgi:transcriptional regulator with GAF, ATPase, and Fis domain
VLCRLNGELVHVLFTIVFPPRTDLRSVVVSIMDISARKKAEDRLRLLQEITTDFSKAVTPKDVADVMMARVVPMLSGHVGSVVMLDEDGETLHLLSDHGVSKQTFDQFKRTDIHAKLPLTNAVRDRHPVWIETFDQLATQYPEVSNLISKTSRSQAMACLPLMINDRFIAE